MKTDDLIRTLAADNATRAPSVERRFALFLLSGLVASALLFALLLGPRPDIAQASGEAAFLFKFVVTLALALSASWLACRLARPGTEKTLAAAALLAAPFILGLLVFAEFQSVAPAMRTTKLVGASWLSCLTFIPVLSLPVLAATLIALRHGAPTRPALTGAVAGLVAGGFGAAIYAAYCPEDSPFFLATWYTLAIVGVSLLGGLIGARLLRW